MSHHSKVTLEEYKEVSYTQSTLKENLRQGLKQVCLDAVAPQFLPSSSRPDIPEASVAEYISYDANAEHTIHVCI